jgi:protease III
MGSDKYQPNALKAFVEANGGSTNAFTGADITTYYFSVDPRQLEAALDRFSAAIASPTFAPEMGRKEVNAVNAEWRSRFETDQFVIQRVNSATLNPEHPLTKLGVSNERTLGQHSDEALLEAVKTFYRQYYSSDRMTLSLVGPQSFKQLQSLARQHFGQLPKHEVPDIAVTEPAFSKDSLAQHIYVKSKVKGDLMVLQFPLEDNQHHWPYQPNQYLHHLLISVEGGTFYHRMDELGYLNGYQVYLMPQAFVSQGTANIILPLTEKGAANKNQILSAFFNYVELIKRQGIDKAYADELKRLLNRQFEDFKAPGASQLARHLTMELQKLSPEHVMHAQYHFAEFKPDTIKATLADIRPQSLRLWHISEDQQAATKVPDAQGYYSVKPFTEKDYTAWQPSAELVLAIPEPQQQQEEIKVVKSDADLSTPQLVHQRQGARAFLAHCQHHQGREGIVSLVINSALPMQNVQNLVYANILGNIYYRDNQRLMQRAQRRAGTQLAVQMGNTVIFPLLPQAATIGMANLLKICWAALTSWNWIRANWTESESSLSTSLIASANRRSRLSFSIWV